MARRPDDPTELQDAATHPSTGGGEWSLGALARRWFGEGRPATDELAGRYRTGDLLGRGGMGEVRIAHDRRLRRDVALKTTLDESDEGVGRFLHEAQVTGQLSHPNIPPIYDVGMGPEGSVFFTMQALPGRPLSHALQQDGAPSLARALELFGKVCDAVAYAHARGVLHRDLKPGNILVGDFGEVYVIDWGLAKRLDDLAAVSTDPDESGEPFTREGRVVGTPGYMSPEQAAGDPAIDERADVYSLGAVLYALLTGRPPFRSGDRGVLLKVHRGEFPPPRSVRPDLPWELDQVVRKAMSLRPGGRYPSVVALQQDLRAYQEERPLPGLRYGLLRRAGRTLTRHRRALLTTAAVGSGLALLVSAFLVLYAVTLTVARDRALAAEGEATDRAIDLQVALARVRAETGETGTARAELLDAAERSEARGRDPIAARLTLSALDDRWPPPEVVFHGGPLDAMAFDPEDDRTALVTGRELAVVDLLTGSRRSTWLAPEGATVAIDGWRAGSVRARVRVGRHVTGVDETGRTRYELDLPPDAGEDLLITPDDRLLVLQRGAVSEVWSVAAAAPIGVPILGVVTAISADGTRGVRHLPTGGGHRQVTRVELVDLATGAVLAGRDGLIEAVYSPDLSTVFLAGADRVTAERWDGTRIWEAQDLDDPALALSPDGSQLVTFGTDGTASAFDAATGRRVLWRRAGDGRRSGAGATQVGHGWMGADVGPAFHVWSWVDRPEHPPSHARAALAVDASPDGVLAATSDWGGEVALWDWRTRRALARVPVSDQAVRAVAFSPDGARLATGDRAGRLRTVDVATGEVGAPLEVAHGIVMGVVWRSDDEVVAACEDGTLVRWSPGSGRITAELRTGVMPWALDLRGDRVVVSGRGESDGLGELWDLTTGERLDALDEEMVAYGAALSPDGQAFAVGTADGRVVARDQGRLREYPATTGGPVMAVTYSPDGRLVLGGTLSGDVRIWDRETASELLALDRHEGSAQGLVFVGEEALLSHGGEPASLSALRLTGVERPLTVPVDGSPPLDDPGAAIERAERRGDWAHALRAAELTRASGQEVPASRLARLALAAGDLEGCLRALPTAEPGVAPASLAALRRACGP